MQWREILKMAIHDMWQRKTKSLLNLIGIVIGCTCMLLTAIGAAGVEKAVKALFESSEYARQIVITSNGVRYLEPPEGTIVVKGEMSDERRERIEQGLTRQWRREQSANRGWGITKEQLKEIQTLAGVRQVYPECSLKCEVSVVGQADPLTTQIVSAHVESTSAKSQLLVGALPSGSERQEVVVSELLAYRLGFRSDGQLDSLVGKQLTVTYEVQPENLLSRYGSMLQRVRNGAAGDIGKTLKKLVADLDKTTLTEEEKQFLRSIARPQVTTARKVTLTVTVSGVTKESGDESIAAIFRHWFHGTNGGLHAHPDVATKLQQDYSNGGKFNGALVLVDEAKQLKPVSDSLKKMGINANSSLRLLKHIEDNIQRKSWFIYGLALAILFTSAIGISNTLILSVIQRTPEFGILKSVGARDRDLLWIMLTEGFFLGVVGAMASLVTAWTVAKLGQGIFASFVSQNLNGELEGDLFVFSWLPVLVMFAIAIFVCIVASVLPAWRAARLDPVVAMQRR